MDTDILHFMLLVLGASILIAAACYDVYCFKIPNVLSMLLILIFPFFVMSDPQLASWHQNLVIFILLILAGFAAYVGNLVGAGDIKLLAATGLWAGPSLVAPFLTVTALTGGVLALVMIALIFANEGARKFSIKFRTVPLPYGVAIAVGGLSAFYQLSQPFLLPS